MIIRPFSQWFRVSQDQIVKYVDAPHLHRKEINDILDTELQATKAQAKLTKLLRGPRSRRELPSAVS